MIPNSKYFHVCATNKKNRSSINLFTNKEGHIIANPNHISNAISVEFKERFISNSCCTFNSETGFSLLTSIISEEDNDFLSQEVLLKRLKLLSLI